MKESEEAIRKAGRILAAGGTVAFPTDTVYGLGAVCTNKSAVRKIFEAKKRPAGKPLGILVSDAAQAESLVLSVPPEVARLMEAFWPGALTLIMKSAFESEEVLAGGDSVGIRMPASETARAVIRAAGSPLAAPSANISGRRSSVTAEDVREDLGGKIDMIIDGGPCPGGMPSTVVDLSDGGFRILREGPVTAEMIEECLGRCK